MSHERLHPPRPETIYTKMKQIDIRFFHYHNPPPYKIIFNPIDMTHPLAQAFQSYKEQTNFSYGFAVILYEGTHYFCYEEDWHYDSQAQETSFDIRPLTQEQLTQLQQVDTFEVVELTESTSQKITATMLVQE